MLELSNPDMLRRLYDWCIAAADKPYATWLMGSVSFVESSFFPDPAGRDADSDVAGAAGQGLFLCHPVHPAHRSPAACSAISSARCFTISLGLWLIQLYGYGDKVEAFRESYAEWGGWIILLKGVTPIPYKIVTIASGFAGYNLLLFVLLSLVARGMRFYLARLPAAPLWAAGARSIIEERLGFWVTIGAIVLVAGIIAALYLF